MATPCERIKQQPTATPWENKQNCGLRLKIPKVARRFAGKTVFAYFPKKSNSPGGIKSCAFALCSALPAPFRLLWTE
jgi:hypothetical protein